MLLGSLRRASPAVLLIACGLLGACTAPSDSTVSTTRATAASPSSEPSLAVTACVPPAPDLVAAASSDAACAPNGGALDDALDDLGTSRCDLTIDPALVARGVVDGTDPRQLASFAPLHLRPMRAAAFADLLGPALDGALAQPFPVASAIGLAAAAKGRPLGPAPTCTDASWSTYDADDASPLATALGLPADAVAGAPLDVQRALVPIVHAIAHARDEVTRARAGARARLDDVYAMASWILGSWKLTFDHSLLAAIDGVDIGAMETAAVELALAVESAHLERFAGRAMPSLDLHTSIGPVVLRGPGCDTYAPDAVAVGPVLLLDTGGDDVYRVPVASASMNRPVSIAIDLGGDDLYTYDAPATPTRAEATPTVSRVTQQGGAALGVALLFDLGKGRDEYRSLTLSQGSAVDGVGVLYDDGGDDTYQAEALSQGAAAWGTGLLLDAGGNDSYAIVTKGQGYGFTQGAGLLLDGGGDDRYFAEPGPGGGLPDAGPALYPSGQVTTANQSMAQGCGEGRRPDLPPGAGFAGGLGVLRDGGGDDTYVAGVFAQGCGFAMGAGFLLEAGGDDAYDGLYYVQGASAHTAIGVFVDDGGDDTYDAVMRTVATSIGVGHDLSLGLHRDTGGDDAYRAPLLSLGTGSANGVGVFVADGGDDTFTAVADPALGAATPSDLAGTERASEPTIGVFAKSAGSASYEVGGKKVKHAKSTWTSGGTPGTGARGVGVDKT